MANLEPRLTADTVESPLPSNRHGGFGERSGETGRWQHRNRAPGRLDGVTFLPARDGQRWIATTTCLVSSQATASLLSGRPRRLGNSGSVGVPARSRSQTFNTATV